MGAERLQHRLRRLPGRGRQARRPARPPARVFLLGLFVFTLSSVLCAIAPTLDALVVFRVVQALGAALDRALVARPGARRLPGGSARARGRLALGGRRAGRGPRSLARRVAGRRRQLAPGLPRQPAGRDRRLLALAALSGREPGSRAGAGSRICPGRCIFAVAIAALVLGVVKGSEWGWASRRGDRQLRARDRARRPSSSRRCRTHRSPIVDLALLRIRTFSVANSLTILGAAGFYAYTLCNVLFLTAVWGYSVLEAGLAITPGPFVAAAVAGPASRIAERIGASRRARRRRPDLGRGACSGSSPRVGLRARLPRRVAAGHDPARDRRRHAVSEHQRRRRRLGPRRRLRHRDRPQLGCPPGRGGARRRDRGHDHRRPDPGRRSPTPSTTPGPSPPPACSAPGSAASAVRRLRPEQAAEAPSLASAARLRAHRGREPGADAAVAPGSPGAGRRSSSTRCRSGPRRSPTSSPRRRSSRRSRQPMLESLAAQAEPLRLSAGEWLFREGDEGDALYVVQRRSARGRRRSRPTGSCGCSAGARRSASWRC